MHPSIGPHERQMFQENGFLVLRQVVPPAEREELGEALERVRDKVRATPEKFRTRHLKKTSDTWGCSDIFEPELYEPSFANYLGRPELLNIIRALLGSEKLRFWGGHALWSPEEATYDLHWHRDGKPEFYNPLGHANHVQFNTALGPDPCFLAIPGSHRRALTNEEREQFDQRRADPLPGETVVECEPGDVLFMNAWTFHRGRSAPGAGRRTLHFNLQPAHEPYGGASTREWMKDPAYLDKLPPPVRELMENLIAWDRDHPAA